MLVLLFEFPICYDEFIKFMMLDNAKCTLIVLTLSQLPGNVARELSLEIQDLLQSV